MCQLPYIEHGLLEVPEWRLIFRYLDNTFPDRALKAPMAAREVGIAAASHGANRHKEPIRTQTLGCSPPAHDPLEFWLQAAVACAAIALVDTHLHPLHSYTRWVEVRFRSHAAHICARAMVWIMCRN